MAQRRRAPSIQWVVVSVGLGLVGFLAIAGTLRNEFDYTYVALAALGLVGLVVRNALEDEDNDDEPS